MGDNMNPLFMRVIMWVTMRVNCPALPRSVKTFIIIGQ